MALVLTVLAVFLLLIVSEYWWRKHPQPNELSRKFVHITVGSFVAFWPFFLSWNQIIFLSAAFLVGVGASKYLNIFKAIHSVQRPTWGELFFAAAVGIIAMITHSKGIYAVALLQMSLADGLAAIVGLRFGTGNRYKVFGSTKSIAGTATFFVISLALLIGYSQLSEAFLPLAFLAALALCTSLIENLGIVGLDNLLVPLVIAYVLSL
ncbi:MAG: phosphatidate cytidylyltransferase [Candidatus Saccharibacteria bacterium]|nr:phosphatidate cytidylyltransferase [Candidatus Saccharibacteria bacterium]